MNSQQVSNLFNTLNNSNNQSNQQFNPIQTFGNRNSQDLHKTKQKHQTYRSKQSYTEQNKRNQRSDQQDQNQDQLQDQKQQTRIKLLNSFQQSYLGTISQRILTQSQHYSDMKNNQRISKLSYTQSKRSDIKLQKYLNTQPIDQVYQHQTQYQNYYKHRNISNNNQNSKHIQNINSSKLLNSNQSSSYPSSKLQYQKKVQQIKDNIKALSLAIEQQSYNLSIQERLYEYLMIRIDQRGRKRKLKDNHQIVEKAIDFMDAGEQFMREIKKLMKLQNM